MIFFFSPIVLLSSCLLACKGNSSSPCSQIGQLFQHSYLCWKSPVSPSSLSGQSLCTQPHSGTSVWGVYPCSQYCAPPLPAAPQPSRQAASHGLCRWFDLPFLGFFFGTLKVSFLLLSVIVYFKYFTIIYPDFLCIWNRSRVVAQVLSFHHLH